MTGHTCTPAERELLALPVRLGGLGLTNPCRNATKEYKASIRVTQPLVKQIEARALELAMMMTYGKCSSTTKGRMKNILEKGEPLSLLQKRARLVG